MGNQWWGYLHKNGSLQVKRCGSRLESHEAYGSPFILIVCGPWPADSHEEAIECLKRELEVVSA